MSRLRNLPYDAASFFFAHLFLVPLVVVIAVGLLARAYGNGVALAACVALALYIPTYFGGADRTGRRYWHSFTKPWLGCHQYFPVRTLMWDAVSNTFQDGPAPGHRSTFDVDRRTYVFG